MMCSGHGPGTVFVRYNLSPFMSVVMAMHDKGMVDANGDVVFDYNDLHDLMDVGGECIDTSFEKDILTKTTITCLGGCEPIPEFDESSCSWSYRYGFLYVMSYVTMLVMLIAVPLISMKMMLPFLFLIPLVTIMLPIFGLALCNLNAMQRTPHKTGHRRMHRRSELMNRSMSMRRSMSRWDRMVSTSHAMYSNPMQGEGTSSPLPLWKGIVTPSPLP